MTSVDACLILFGGDDKRGRLSHIVGKRREDDNRGRLFR